MMRAMLIGILSASLLQGCASTASARKGDLKDGMTQAQVWKQWGQPDQIEQRSAGAASEETWHWGKSATALFANGKLTYWSR